MDQEESVPEWSTEAQNSVLSDAVTVLPTLEDQHM
jgi:hypothetical protein